MVQAATADARVISGQKRALELAVTGAPLADVLDEIVKTVEAQSSNNVLASILLVARDGKRLRHGAAPSLPPAYNAAIDGIEIGPRVGSCGTAAHLGETVVVRDIATDPLWGDFKELALRHELAACWSTPIKSSSGVTLGTFALYHRTPCVPTDRDREIVELLGRTAAVVIERDRNAQEREEAEHKLRAAHAEQAAQLRRMFEHAPVGIALLRGPTHRFEIANPGYLELARKPDVIGRTVREVFPELAGQGYFELLDGVYRSGKAYVGHAQLVRLEHGNVYVDFVYEPTTAPDGTIDGILVAAFEVTELVTARQRAEDSERALATFIDNLPELAWTARPDGYIDYYNRRWYEYTGTTFEDMQGWGWEKVHDPNLLDDVKTRWKHSLATGEPFEMEFTLRGADGIPRWFLTRVAPLRDASGAIVRWFGTNTNIDEIKSAVALSSAMAQQSMEVQQMVLELRASKEAAEQRVRELETTPRP